MWDVKSVTEDLGAEIVRPRSRAHSTTWSEWVVRALTAVWMSGEEKESVKSSAYEEVSCGEGG